MKRLACIVLLIIILCVLCGGCSAWTSGEYLSVTPRDARTETYENRVIEVTSYTQLRNALTSLVRNGAEDGIISISAFNKGTIHFYVDTAISNVIENTAYGAYAVEKITYEIGTNRGVSVVACKIHYRSGYQQPAQIKQIGDAQELIDIITKALEDFDSSVLVLMEQYEKVDVIETVEAFAACYPDRIAEIPSVEVNVYPDKGAERIIEISFEYEKDQVQLQQLRAKSEEAFRLVESSVQGPENELEVYEHLYLYLTNQCKYVDAFSSMPAYDLLVNGVGNEKAFADVYTRICNRIGLGCKTVTGTRNGKNWTWNSIQIRGKYYYVDLLHCAQTQEFRVLTESELLKYRME